MKLTPQVRIIRRALGLSRQEFATQFHIRRRLTLKGNLKDYHSIRINDQWRVIFKWINGEPHDVQIVDYH